MNRLIFLFLVLFSLNSTAQYDDQFTNNGFHFKAIAALAVGPETGVAFPPKVSFYAFIPRQKYVYGGVDLALGTLGFSKTAGATIGFQYKFLVLENSFTSTSVYQSHAPNKKWLSNNVKIGIEIEKFTFKVGPSFIVREYNGHHDIQDILKIGDQHFNIEIGYIFDSN